VAAARKAFNTAWGKKVTGTERARLIAKLADLMERDMQDLAELESLDNGKPIRIARCVLSCPYVRIHYWTDVFKNSDADIADSIGCLRYYAGWADKIQGKVRHRHFLSLLLSDVSRGVDDRSQRPRQVCLYSARTRGRLRSDVSSFPTPSEVASLETLTDPNEYQQYSLELSDHDVGVEGKSLFPHSHPFDGIRED
jgi:hypothetical protein